MVCDGDGGGDDSSSSSSSHRLFVYGISLGIWLVLVDGAPPDLRSSRLPRFWREDPRIGGKHEDSWREDKISSSTAPGPTEE